MSTITLSAATRQTLFSPQDTAALASTTGAANLVNADMKEEALAISAFSLANRTNQGVL